MDDQSYGEVIRHTMNELTAQFARPTDIYVTLASVTASCVELVEGADCADVLLMSGHDGSEALAATSQLAVAVDALQQRFREGPCLDAGAGEPVVVCNNLRGEPRWPRFSEAAVAAGIHSTLSFQLYTHDGRMGALNLFGTRPDAFTFESRTVGAMFATHAAVALIAHDERLQFRSALASRDIIGQAKGMIMERFDVDAVRAFELLKRLSQENNEKLAWIAEELVSRGPERKARSFPQAEDQIT
jgi:hypothetical protein